MKLVACRPAKILSDIQELNEEFRAARWVYHRLLDFEDSHQQHLDTVQEACAPGLTRIGRILAILRHRERRRERSTRFVPNGHPALRKYLESKISQLREQRNADERWKQALKWADEPGPDSKEKGTIRRKKGESDEDFKKRSELPRLRSRREQYQTDLYPQRRCFYDTWNQEIASCKRARTAVLKQRSKGLPAEWRRPRWDDPNTITAQKPNRHFRVIERNRPWWIIEMRLHQGWVRFQAKIERWHELSDESSLVQCQLTRKKNGCGWKYSVSLLFDGVEKKDNFAQSGVVSLDWGHREFQHDTAKQGLRVFFAVGEDGTEGELLLPIECRKLLDRRHEIQSVVDSRFNARKDALKLPDKNRYVYRKRLMRLGVRTKEQQDWLSWEMRQERRIAKCRKRIEHLRLECYTQAIRNLRKRYKTFILEDESTRQHQQNDKDEKTRHRKRQNRDMSARYLFVSLCKRLGADVVTVPARNSTRECPDPTCDGILPVNGPELVVVCPKCGRVRDKDRGACIVLLRRGKEALANRGAAA